MCKTDYKVSWKCLPGFYSDVISSNPKGFGNWAHKHLILLAHKAAKWKAYGPSSSTQSDRESNKPAFQNPKIIFQ